MVVFPQSLQRKHWQVLTAFESAHERLDRLDCLLLTFGSAWVYENKKTGTVVANRHKQPESRFTRRMLSVCEIVSDYTSLLSWFAGADSLAESIVHRQPHPPRT